MARQPSYDAARKLVEKELGHRMRDAFWRYLLDMGLVHEFIIGQAEPSELAERVRYLESNFASISRDVKDDKPSPSSPPNHLVVGRYRHLRKGSPSYEALIERVAALAAQIEPVRSFRARVLHDRLLSAHEVERWLRHQAEEDGPCKVLKLEVPVPWEYQQKDTWEATLLSLQDIDAQVSTGFEYPSVWYYEPQMGIACEMYVNPNGVLGQLRQVSWNVARSYHWQLADATSFILTGSCPPIASIIETIEYLNVWGKRAQALSRITLEIDPALPPRVLAKVYADIRRFLGIERNREPTDKSRQLAEFTQARPFDESWTKRMVAWNKKYPKWAYKQEDNFGRDCRQAQRRLVGANLPQGRKPSARNKKAQQN